MAQACIQEQFACPYCGQELIRIDFTAPVSFQTLQLIWNRLIEPARAALESPCDRCSAQIHAVPQSDAQSEE